MCEERVVVDYKIDGTPVTTQCGHTRPDGGYAICEKHEALLRKQYPQGWRYVPGDVCKHGSYIGDAYGPDYMCHYCEMGE